MTDIEKLRAFAHWVVHKSFERDGLDGSDVQAKAHELGLLVAVPFDPEKHDGLGAEFCEPGDDWLVPSLLLTSETPTPGDYGPDADFG